MRNGKDLPMKTLSRSTKSARQFALAMTLALFSANLPVRGQAESKPPRISERISPCEVISPATTDQRKAVAVVRKPPGKGPFPAIILLHGGFKKLPVETLNNHYEENPNFGRFLAAV
jgi:hypothetical protein